MKFKLLQSISAFVLLTLCIGGCNEDNPDITPLQVNAYIKYIDINGESLLKQFYQGSNDPVTLDESVLSVKLSNEASTKRNVSVVYLPAYDCINIQISDHEKIFDKDVNYQLNYLVDIKMPPVIGDNTDTMIVSYHIKGYDSSLNEVKYNDNLIENPGLEKTELNFTITVSE